MSEHETAERTAQKGATMSTGESRPEDKQNSSENLYVICCVCGQIKINDQWVDFTDELKEEYKDKKPTHGICYLCSEQLR